MNGWLRKFVLAFGAISALAQSAPPKPAIALIDGTDAPQWQTWAGPAGWQVIVPDAAADANIDARVQALEAAVQSAIQKGGADSTRVYLAARGEAAAAVFYAISRAPDLWAAGLALGGSPQPAIDSGRFYAANFHNVPVLWITPGGEGRPLAEKLKAASIPLEWRPAEKVDMGGIFEWLKGKARAEHPAEVDCETNSPSFASCYWIRLTKFDAGERNDVLPSSVIQPAIVGALDLGGFGFKLDAPGPGVLVSSLPDKYNGPLKVGDRIVALDGRPIADARQYRELMAQVKEEKPAAAMIERGKSRIRVETSIVLPKRPLVVTARVQGSYDAEQHEVQIISRTVTEMRVTIPAEWVGAVLNWNGVALEKVAQPGCRLLTMDKELENVGPCP